MFVFQIISFLLQPESGCLISDKTKRCQDADLLHTDPPCSRETNELFPLLYLVWPYFDFFPSQEVTAYKYYHENPLFSNYSDRLSGDRVF